MLIIFEGDTWVAHFLEAPRPVSLHLFSRAGQVPEKWLPIISCWETGVWLPQTFWEQRKGKCAAYVAPQPSTNPTPSIQQHIWGRLGIPPLLKPPQPTWPELGLGPQGLRGAHGLLSGAPTTRLSLSGFTTGCPLLSSFQNCVASALAFPLSVKISSLWFSRSVGDSEVRCISQLTQILLIILCFEKNS